jgi:GT2 family glycosyltransferase
VSQDLAQCLESLRANQDVGHEVIVVDNASHDDTLEMLRGFPEARVIANQDNRGFAAANNQALTVATGDYLLLLNPDTVVPPGALRELLNFAASQPEAGVIGPRLLNPDGSLQASCRRFPTVRAALIRHTVLERLLRHAAATRDYLMSDWDHQTPRDVDWVSGACLLVRRAAWEQVGPLDEGFYWGSEDVDYCFRMHRAGWRVMYTPQPAITHAVGRSTTQVIVPTIIRTHRSMQRLYAKHLARSWAGRVAVTVGVWLRAGMLIATFHLANWRDKLKDPRRRGKA